MIYSFVHNSLDCEPEDPSERTVKKNAFQPLDYHEVKDKDNDSSTRI
jgi:hypothetical protein